MSLSPKICLMLLVAVASVASMASAAPLGFRLAPGEYTTNPTASEAMKARQLAEMAKIVSAMSKKMLGKSPNSNSTRSSSSGSSAFKLSRTNSSRFNLTASKYAERNISQGYYDEPYYPLEHMVEAHLATKNQSLIIGSIQPGDRLLMQETAYKKGTMLMISSTDITYPKLGMPSFPKINCIKVLDQQIDGNNGEIKVKEGGVGTNKVLLRFHSKRGLGLHYVVQIYGK